MSPRTGPRHRKPCPMARRRWLATLALLALSTLATLGCDVQLPQLEPPGQLAVVIQTDMGIPDGLDRIEFTAELDHGRRIERTYQLAPNGSVKLPVSLLIFGSLTLDTTANLRAVGYRGGEARVESHIIAPIPPSQTSMVRMPLQWLCDGTAKENTDGTVTSTCPPVNDLERTCVAGFCESPSLTDGELPPFDLEAVLGGVSGVCFQTQDCFAIHTELKPIRSCLFHVANVTTAQTLNVGIKVDETVPGGICGDYGCFIALDRDNRAGFKILPTTGSKTPVELPEAVCEALESGKGVEAVVASTICPTKSPALPTCGPWSAVTNSVSPDLGPLGDLLGPDGSFPVLDDVDAAAPKDFPVIDVTDGTNVPVPQGQTVILQIPGVDPDKVLWTTNDANILAVSARGEVTPIGSGTAVVTALGLDLSVTRVTIVVQPPIDPPPTSHTDPDGSPILLSVPNREIALAIAPQDPRAALGVPLQLSAAARFLDGTTMPVAPEAVTWSSEDPAAVSITPDGVATAWRRGPVPITAETETLSTQATFTGVGDVIVPQGCQPTEEICDDLDNDCNGFIDDRDLGGDGVPDCLNVLFVGQPASVSESDFKDWLSANFGLSAERIHETPDAEPLTASTLDGYDVVVLDALARNYTEAESRVLLDWVKAGGGLMSMNGFGGTQDRPRGNSLLSAFGIRYAGGLENGPVTDFVPHPVTFGVMELDFFDGYGISGFEDSGGVAIAWLPSGAAAGAALELGSGRAMFWGDDYVQFEAGWTPLDSEPLFWLNTASWLANLQILP